MLASAELSMRIGLHSGPVTAGVLRGDRARFQLFGDTANTAARMEQLGQAGKIQVSSETAELLDQAGKSDWVVKREDTVSVKGKGQLQTYWLTMHASSDRGNKVSDDTTFEDSPRRQSDVVQAQDVMGLTKSSPLAKLESTKIRNLVKWNVEVLSKMLKQITADRLVSDGRRHSTQMAPRMNFTKQPIEEVAEVVTLPQHARNKSQYADSIDLDELVMQQLHDFVAQVAGKS